MRNLNILKKKKKITFVWASVDPLFFALTVLHVIFPLALVFSAVIPDRYSESHRHIVHELALEAGTVILHEIAFPVTFVQFELAWS